MQLTHQIEIWIWSMVLHWIHDTRFDTFSMETAVLMELDMHCNSIDTKNQIISQYSFKTA